MRSLFWKAAAFAVWLGATCGTVQGAETLIDVPLNIREISGVERIADPVSFGVPFPQGMLFETKGIAVHDESGKTVPGQFKVLERWVDRGQDGSIKWLLVTFLAHVPANGEVAYRLKTGVNPRPLRPASIERIDRLWAEIDLELTLPEREMIRKTQGRRSVVEEGPVRSCVRYETDSTPGQIGYIVWIYDYGDSDRRDTTVVLKNTPRVPSGPLFFKDFSLIWNRKGSDFELGGDKGKTFKGIVEKAKGFLLYQDSSGTDRWDKLGEWQDKAAAYVPPNSPKADLGYPAFRGYVIRSGETEMGRGEQALGWVRLGDHGIAVRNFWQQFPKAVEVEADRIRVHLWPKYWKAHGGIHWLDDMQRKAHDLAFFDRPISEADAIAFNDPLTIHCGLDWYKRTGAVGYISDKAALKPQPDPKALGRQEYGWHKWGTYWLDTIHRRYHQFPMDPFIQTADPYEAKKVWLYMRGSADLTPAWVDHYRFPEDAFLLRPNCYGCTLRETGSYTELSEHHGLMPWNMQHLTCLELYDGYRLFGDPLAFDAIDKLASWVQAWVHRRSEKTGGESRLDALPQNVLVDSYRLLERPSILDSISNYIDFIWITINKDRGYYIPNTSEKYPEGFEKVFMLAYLAEGLESTYQLTGDLRCLDMTYGMTQYVLREPFINSCYVTLYETPIDLKTLQEERSLASASPTAACDCSVFTEKEKKDECKAWRDWRISSLLTLSYLHFRDPLFLEMFNAVEDTLKMKGGQLHAETGESPAPVLKVYQYLREKAPLEGESPKVVGDLKAFLQSDGKIRLQWTNPPGVDRYYIKFFDKPIKEALRIPEDMGQAINFWAAEPIVRDYDSLPQAGKPGEVSSYVVPIPGTAQEYWFALKAIGKGAGLSSMSNTVRVQITSAQGPSRPAPPQNLTVSGQ